MTKTCTQCGEPFTTTHRNRNTCSRVCAGLTRRRRVELTCAHCQRPFQVRPSDAHHPQRGTRRFCSQRCANAVLRNCLKSREAQRIGGLRGAETRFGQFWQRALDRVKDMTKAEAFKWGYVLGYRRRLRKEARDRKAAA